MTTKPTYLLPHQWRNLGVSRRPPSGTSNELPPKNIKVRGGAHFTTSVCPLFVEEVHGSWKNKMLHSAMTKCLNNTTTTETALHCDRKTCFCFVHQAVSLSSLVTKYLPRRGCLAPLACCTPRGGRGATALLPPYPLVTPLYPHTANKMPKHCTSQTHDVYDTCLTAETKIKTQKINQHCQRKQTNNRHTDGHIRVDYCNRCWHNIHNANQTRKLCLWPALEKTYVSKEFF